MSRRGRPPGKQYPQSHKILVSEKMDLRIRKAAAEQDRSINEFVRTAIRAFLAANESW